MKIEEVFNDYQNKSIKFQDKDSFDIFIGYLESKNIRHVGNLDSEEIWRRCNLSDLPISFNEEAYHISSGFYTEIKITESNLDFKSILKENGIKIIDNKLILPKNYIYVVNDNIITIYEY